MRLGIMQPYFFPYIGYFSLIQRVDHFILLDEVQFIRHGWIERNRILKPDSGWMYIKVPLEKHSRDTKIKDIKIRTTENWKNKIIQQLSHYKKKAQYYYNVLDIVSDVFSFQTNSIVELNHYSLIKVCEYLGINTPISIFSKMDLKIDNPTAPDEWALNICKKLTVNEYINPPGGKEFFSKEKYLQNNVDLKFLDLKLKAYDQNRSVFEPGLSIIDTMMFNSPKTISEFLNYVKYI